MPVTYKNFGLPNPQALKLARQYLRACAFRSPAGVCVRDAGAGAFGGIAGVLFGWLLVGLGLLVLWCGLWEYGRGAGVCCRACLVPGFCGMGRACVLPVFLCVRCVCLLVCAYRFRACLGCVICCRRIGPALFRDRIGGTVAAACWAGPAAGGAAAGCAAWVDACRVCAAGVCACMIPAAVPGVCCRACWAGPAAGAAAGCTGKTRKIYRKIPRKIRPPKIFEKNSP